MIELDLSRVEFSKRDKLFKIRVPSELTNELAYETGVHIGDGSLPLFKSRSNIYRICYSGNYLSELPFFRNVLRQLLKKLYNKNTKVRKGMTNECRIDFGSKAVFTFKNKVLGLPVSYKNNIFFPPLILQDKKLTLSCLKGIADTDFSLVFLKKYKDVNYYPKIKGDSKSKILVKQMEGIIRKHLNIKPVVSYDVERYDKRTRKTTKCNTIELNGKKCLRSWMKNIGFDNAAQVTKFLVWKRLGYLPKLSLNDRIELLETY